MSLQSLFKQTAIYGISTIVIRFASWLLTPYYARVLIGDDRVAIGISADLLAIMAVVNIIYMIGMETSFFRFTRDHDTDKVYSNTLTTVFINSLFWTILFYAFSAPLIQFLKYPGKELYIYLLASTAFLENICNVPFAKLRKEGRPIRFLILKTINVGLIVILNYFFISVLYLKKISILNYSITDPVIAMFLANLISWIVLFFWFSRDIFNHLGRVDLSFLKEMFVYSLPLIIIGLAGNINEMVDRTLLKNILPYSLKENLIQLSIYSVNYRLAIIMALAIQAFRMGAEPYFFNLSKDKNSQKTYAIIMDFFIIGCCMIMVLTCINREFIGLINGKSYLEGLKIIPILLLAKLFLGIYYNSTIWFKLTDQTLKGVWITLFGTIITIGVNLVLIPKIGYMGSAIATLSCYLGMTVMSILWGHRYFPIPYHYSYNIFWILFSVIYMYYVDHFFRGKTTFLLLFSLFYIISSLSLASKRWKFSKQLLS